MSGEGWDVQQWLYMTEIATPHNYCIGVWQMGDVTLAMGEGPVKVRMAFLIFLFYAKLTIKKREVQSVP